MRRTLVPAMTMRAGAGERRNSSAKPGATEAGEGHGVEEAERSLQRAHEDGMGDIFYLGRRRPDRRMSSLYHYLLSFVEIFILVLPLYPTLLHHRRFSMGN
jgi:hypothetical protein